MKILIAFTVIVSFLNAQDLSGYKLCIDPGHGGHESDDRNMTWANFWESESNLSKAYFLDTLLKNMGATVVLTRHYNGDSGSDNDPGLSERAAVANQMGADHFHSIHSNGGDGLANYSLILYPGPTGDPRINGLSGYPSSPIELTIAQQMVAQVYATNRTTYTTTAGDWTFYGTGRPYLGVFSPLRLPGTLSEGSFHDYKPETWRLKSSAYHKNEAWAIARTFALVYTGTDFTSKNLHNLGGIVRDAYKKVSYSYNTPNDAYQPVNNITVTLNPGGKVFHGDDQNNGYFLFDSLAAGTYELIVSAEGYYADMASVTIGTSFFNFRDFKLASKIPPYVLSTTPANGSANFPAWNPIVINFSRAMDTTLTKAAIIITPEIPLKFTWSGTTILKLSSDSLKFLTGYSITIQASAQDTYGHQFDGNGDGIGGDAYTFSFTTGPEDMTAPKITSFYPEYNSTSVELNPIITIYFDEKIDPTSLSDDNILLTNYSAGDTTLIIYRHYYVGDKSVVHVIPAQALAPNSVYKAYVGGGIRDLFNNVMTIRKLIRFTTGSENWAVTSIDNFEAGVDNWWTPTSSGSTAGVLADTSTARAVDNSIYVFGGTGQKSMKLKVGWDMTSSAWLLREYLSGGAPRNVTFTADKVMQAYVFGDGSNVLFRFAVDDGSSFSGHEVSPWYTIDWIGWKLVSWNMATDGTGSWIGDGTLNGTMRFDSFQLSYNPDDPEAAKSATIYIDDFRIVTVTSVGIEEEKPLTAEKFALHQNYPNPFNPTTTIAFTLPEASNVRIEVFNVLGERVRSLTNARYNTGYWTVIWDGKNSAGMSVPSGTYFYRMITDMGVQVKNMMLLK